MTSTRLGVIAMLMFALSGLVRAAESPIAQPALPPETVKRIDDSLKMLAGGSADDKRLAEDRLLNTTRAALPRVEEALKNPALDPEAHQRLVRIVNRLREIDKAANATQALLQKNYDWNVRTGLEAYDRVGRHDPKWDESARQAIREFLPGIGIDPLAAHDVLQHLRNDLKCDDPLILYAEARSIELASIRETEPEKKKQLLADAIETYGRSCDGFEKLDYPADRKCLAFARLATCLMTNSAKDDEKSRARAKKLADEAIKLLPTAVRLPGITPEHINNVCLWLVHVQMKLGGDRGAIVNGMFPDLLKTFPDVPSPLIFTGEQYLLYAREARGDAVTVTPEIRKATQERLAVAEAALTKAYELDPTDSEPAIEMLHVVYLQGKSRAVMERWFKRATTADPENQSPYRIKIAYLKWYGSPQEMLDFGHECLASRNWSGKIAYVLLQVHETLAQDAPNEAAYWRDPAVWRDVRAVVGRAAAIFPDDARIGSQYAYWAWRCGQWKIADGQFKLLGEKVVVTDFGTQAALDEARTESVKKAGTP